MCHFGGVHRLGRGTIFAGPGQVRGRPIPGHQAEKAIWSPSEDPPFSTALIFVPVCAFSHRADSVPSGRERNGGVFFSVLRQQPTNAP